jgi:hypothetical protein
MMGECVTRTYRALSDINKQPDEASFWIYEFIGILLGARSIHHFSGIKANCAQEKLFSSQQFLVPYLLLS